MTPGFTRYAPGVGRSHWRFVVGRTFVAVFESTVSEPIVDALWWLAESDLASIESVVGAFPLVGEDAVRSFAVASIDAHPENADAHVTAVVRGSACVDVFSIGGARRFGAAGTQPWVLAEFRSVTGLVLGGDDHPTGPVARVSVGSLPLGAGVVEGELLVWSLSTIERVVESASVSVEPVPGSVGLVPVSVEPVVVSAAAPDADADAVADETIIRPRRSRAVDADVPVTAAIPLPVLDDSVRAGGRRPVFATPPDSLLGFRLGGADAMDLDLPVLIGRKPRSPRVTLGVEPRLIEVPSPDLQVSSTHVQLEQVGDAVVVTDLGSTNGTFVVSLGGETGRLKPGESIVVLPGARVDIGDGNIIEITPARDES